MLDEIESILESAKDRIVANLDSNGITASGRTKEGFKVISDDKSVKLIYDRSAGGAPLSTTEQGRESGAIPTDFVSILEQWSRDKNIPFDSDKDRHKFAGAVAFGKIKPRGYGRPSPSDFGSISAVVYTPVVQEAATELYNKVPGIIASYIKSKI